MMKRHQAVALFCCSLLGFLSVFGCGGGGGGSGGGSGSTPQIVTLQGRVDDGLPRSPIANATCNFSDLQGNPLAMATADGSGTFQLRVPLNMQGFLRCTPPSLPNLEMSTFVSTVGRTAGEIIANLTVTPTTTLVAAVLTNTSPPDPQARAAELMTLLGASDPDLSLLAQASTVLYSAQLANGIDVAFSSGSENEGGPDGGGPDGGATDGGGTGGDAGDGGAFSPLPGAVCDFALTMDGSVLRNVTLADLLANGAVVRPDLQAIASQVNVALAGRQTAVVAAYSRLFPNGLGRPISTTADANGKYFLSTPPGVPGFVRCTPSEAANLILARFVRARQTGEQLMGQTVTPITTVAAMAATNALQARLDPVPIQQAFLTDIAPLQILLPNRPNGNGMFATVRLLPGTTLTNPNAALLAFAATTIFDTMRLQRANIPVTITFADALRDYFQDATFAPSLAPLTQGVNTALDQGQPVIGLGRNDIPLVASTGTIVGMVTAPNGTPLAGVQVVATQQGATVQRTQTDALGRFTLANVQPGSTTVTATRGSASASRTLTVVAEGTVPLTVTLPINQPPVANAGPVQTVFVQQTVTLDGRASSDPDGEPLIFQWSFVTTPTGSRATLSDPTAPQPTFVPDLPGTYMVQLLVNDGVINSTPATVIITANTVNLLSPRFAYVANGEGTVSMYIVDATTGQLRHNGYVAAGGTPESVTVDPAGRFVYVVNINSNNISGYTISASSGALTPIPGSPFAAGTNPRLVTVDPTGRFAYVANENSNNISGYTITATTGALTPIPGSPFAAGTFPLSVTVDPTGRFAYVANQSSNNISGYTISASSGALTSIFGSPFGTDSFGPFSVTVDPTSRFVYVANFLGGDISGYTISASSGALTPVPGSPFAAGPSPQSVTVDPTGRFVYVADVRGDISGYTINASSGALTPIPGSPFAAGTFPSSVMVDPSGRFVYVTNTQSEDVSEYTISATTGALTAVGTVRARFFPTSIALTGGTAPVTITPRFAYVANAGSNNVSGYQIDASSGALAPIPGSPFAAGSSPQSVTVEPSGRFAYVANAGSNNISGYRIDASSGALTPIGSPVAAGSAPASVTVDSTGRFAYVANFTSNNISGYIISATTGALTPIGPPVAAGTNPISVTVDPTGHFAYVANNQSNNISRYIISASTGALIPPSFFTAGTNPISVTVDPTGRFAYVTNANSNNISGYTISITTGALTPITGSPFTAGVVPFSVTVDPTGRFAYVTNQAANNISGYTISASSGTLTPLPSSPFTTGTTPRSVTVDPTGRFAYVANNSSNNISGYTISATTGVLTPIVGSPFPAGVNPIGVITSGTIQ